MELLERGLTPKQIADLFYSSVYHCDMDTWLATLCDELKSNPSPAGPGGFAMTGWYVRSSGHDDTTVAALSMRVPDRRQRVDGAGRRVATSCASTARTMYTWTRCR